MSKREYIGTTVDSNEKERIHRAAKGLKLSVSEYVRRCLINSADSTDPVVVHSDLLTVSEAAEYLKVSRGTIDKLLRNKKIEHYRFETGGIRVSKKALDHYIETSNCYPKEDSDDEILLSTGEAAKISHVTPPTIVRWCREGKLTGFRVGGRYRIRKSSLLALFS